MRFSFQCIWLWLNIGAVTDGRDIGHVQFGTRFGSISMDKDNGRTDWTKKRQTEIVLISSEQPKSNSVIQRHIYGLTWGSLLLTDFFL
jgi:hypothetical protein